MSDTVSIPLVCVTDDCPRFGRLVNMISEYPLEILDAFYEDYDGSEAEDACPICGQPAVPQDALLE